MLSENLRAGVARLLVIDDHPVVVRGVRTMLERQPDFELVGEACSAAEGIEKVRTLRPDITLLDLRLPDADVLDTVAALRSAAPDSKILIFTAFSNPVAVAVAVDAGVDGILVKDAAEGEMIQLLRSVLTGASVFQLPRTTRADEAHVPPLTRGEIQVLREVAKGRSNAEAAESLVLSANTVKSYLQSAMKKLGAHNRVEALLRAMDVGLI